MATLPDPMGSLSPADQRIYDTMSGGASGAFGQVYVRMFNNAPLTELVGHLVGHVGNGLLPGDVRELVILHVASRLRIGYEWAHHAGPAAEAGLSAAVIAALDAGRPPEGLRPDQGAALTATDAALDLRSVPVAAQDVLRDAYGDAGVVELVTLVGLYRLVGGVIRAFDIEVEPGLPRALVVSRLTTDVGRRPVPADYLTTS